MDVLNNTLYFMLKMLLLFILQFKLFVNHSFEMSVLYVQSATQHTIIQYPTLPYPTLLYLALPYSYTESEIETETETEINIKFT